MPNTYTVACYYFPNYHIDPRNERDHGPGWTEWALVKRAEPRFPGHRQPRVPVWGYEDESDPLVMAKKLAAAADHGIDAFIFDWYWYNDGPFLERGLEQGFLAAPNRQRMKFSLMWANHDWVDIHPAKVTATLAEGRVLYPGAVTRQTFDTLTDYVIERYFTQPTYWLLDGCPYFSIYELHKLLESFGGVEPTRKALQAFRAKVKQAGFPDLHLNAVIWSVPILPGERGASNAAELLKTLGFDSSTSYVWVHHGALDTFPESDYNGALERYLAYWTQAESEFDLPYFPNVTMGWDSSPRTVQSDVYINAGYPFTPLLADNTAENFKAALAAVKARLDQRTNAPKILNINAWNEWTEGSYLEPDTAYGLGYLEAIREIFGEV
ncbi:MAG: glycoside hydrolase family 99-like domain-containing protein [Caldilineaceae bacterium]